MTMQNWNGTLLIRKHEGITSFGMIEAMQRELCASYGVKRRDLPKMGHGGTLDPFATGLLAVCVGRAVKLARYFLGSSKTYEGVMKFGATTIPGDNTEAPSETTAALPTSLEQLRELAQKLTLQPYLQTPPMHSAKKKDGVPLYELARQGLEVERDAKLCHLYQFDILDYADGRARFRLVCSSGTYVRTLTQDFARMLGSLAYLDALDRTASGHFSVKDAWTMEQVAAATAAKTPWDELPCFVPFDRLLEGYPRAEATDEEKLALLHGKQNALFSILKRVEPPRAGTRAPDDAVAIYCRESLIAVARRDSAIWGIERVFAANSQDQSS